MKTSAELMAEYPAIVNKKTQLSAFRMIVSGILAGIFIGLGGLGCQIASTAIGGTAGKVMGAFIFPVGLFLVVTVGTELFTGNCLLVIPWIGGEDKVKISGILKNWILVYIGNFIGGLLLALCVYYSDLGKMFDGGLQTTAVATAAAKITLSPAAAIIRGILCNFLVCLAVWVALLAKDVTGKAFAVILPVMLFVLCGFEHSVANMYFIPLGMLYDQSIGLDAFLLGNLLPVTIGNILGGSVIVGGGLKALY